MTKKKPQSNKEPLFETKQSGAAVQHQEPHLTVYPRGHGDIPQHLRDRPNGWIVARLLLSWKQDTTQNVCNQICGQIAETQGRKTQFWGKTVNKVRLVLETLFFQCVTIIIIDWIYHFIILTLFKDPKRFTLNSVELF